MGLFDIKLIRQIEQCEELPDKLKNNNQAFGIVMKLKRYDLIKFFSNNILLRKNNWMKIRDNIDAIISSIDVIGYLHLDEINSDIVSISALLKNKRYDLMAQYILLGKMSSDSIDRLDEDTVKEVLRHTSIYNVNMFKSSKFLVVALQLGNYEYIKQFLQYQDQCPNLYLISKNIDKYITDEIAQNFVKEFCNDQIPLPSFFSGSSKMLKAVISQGKYSLLKYFDCDYNEKIDQAIDNESREQMYDYFINADELPPILSNSPLFLNRIIQKLVKDNSIINLNNKKVFAIFSNHSYPIEITGYTVEILLDAGYRLTKDSPECLRNSQSLADELIAICMRNLIPENFIQLNYLGNNIKITEEQARILVDKGYRLTNDSSECFKSSQAMVMALIQTYLDNAMTDEEFNEVMSCTSQRVSLDNAQEVQTLLSRLIKEKGYRVTNESPYFMKSSLAVLQTIVSDSDQPIDNKENLVFQVLIMRQALKRGNMSISNIQYQILNDFYGQVGITDEQIQKVLYIYINDYNSMYPDLTTLSSFFDENTYTICNQLSFDLLGILKVSYMETNGLKDLVEIITKGELATFIGLYTQIANKYDANDSKISNPSLKAKMFYSLCHLYQENPLIVQNIAFLDQLYFKQKIGISLLNMDSTLITTITGLVDSNECSKALDSLPQQEIDLIKNSSKPKEALYNFLSGNSLTYETLKSIISIPVLTRIKNETHNAELQAKCTMVSDLLKIIDIINNLADNDVRLNQLIDAIFADNDVIIDVRNSFTNLMSEIQLIFAMEANEHLTKIEELGQETSTYEDVPYYDLTGRSFTLYAHVFSGTDITDLVNPRTEGRITICVSPISEIANHTYGSYITVGYSHIPISNFIGASYMNLGSNNDILYNSTDFDKVLEGCNFDLIRELSKGYRGGHSETLLLRDGLIPSCVIVRGTEPTAAEVEAAKQLSACISEHMGITIAIPLVKPAVSRVIKKEQEDVITEEAFERPSSWGDLEELRKTVEQDVGVQDEAYVSNETPKYGGSHPKYQGTIDDKMYLFSSGTSHGGDTETFRFNAMVTAYKVQNLVHLENAVQTGVVTYKGQQYGGTMYIPDTVQYTFDTSSLTVPEIEAFMYEMISDHLMFSYDIKPDNFIKDSTGQMYGIDKEQAFKLLLDPNCQGSLSETDQSTRFRPDLDINGGTTFYQNIIGEIQNRIKAQPGFQEEMITILAKCYGRCCEISQMDDEEYLQETNMGVYIDSYLANKLELDEKVKEEQRQAFLERVLARKRNLAQDYLNIIEEKFGLEVRAWVEETSLTNVSHKRD